MGGRGARACPPHQNSGKYFLGNYHVKFGNFVNFSGSYHVYFGHLVFIHKFRAKMSCPKMLTELLRLWDGFHFLQEIVLDATALTSRRLEDNSSCPWPWPWPQGSMVLGLEGCAMCMSTAPS